MRKKKREPLAAPDLKSAWADFYASTKEDDLAALAEQGWKTISQMVEETGHSLTGISSRLRVLIRQKKFEKSKANIQTAHGIREVAIFRPVSQRRANIRAKH